MVEGGERGWPYRSVGQIQFASEEWLRESAIGGDSAIGGVRWPADKLIYQSGGVTTPESEGCLVRGRDGHGLGARGHQLPHRLHRDCRRCTCNIRRAVSA